MKIESLSKKDIDGTLDQVGKSWPKSPSITKVKHGRRVKVSEDSELMIIGELTLVRSKEALVPFLKDASLGSFSKVMVDPGAVKFVCNGANVMRPGIKEFFGNFKAGDIVAVQESQHSKFIAVGIAIVDMSSAKAADKGAVVRNIHYVGDESWECHKLLPTD